MKAYLIYECEHGWCIKRENPPKNTFEKRDLYWSTVFAFSRLTQALWWLGRHVRTLDEIEAQATAPDQSEGPAS